MPPTVYCITGKAMTVLVSTHKNKKKSCNPAFSAEAKGTVSKKVLANRSRCCNRALTFHTIQTKKMGLYGP